MYAIVTEGRYQINVTDNEWEDGLGGLKDVWSCIFVTFLMTSQRFLQLLRKVSVYCESCESSKPFRFNCLYRRKTRGKGITNANTANTIIILLTRQAADGPLLICGFLRQPEIIKPFDHFYLKIARHFADPHVDFNSIQLC